MNIPPFVLIYFFYGLAFFSMGLLVAMLSITGIVIWWRKRRSRQLQAQRAPARTLSIQ